MTEYSRIHYGMGPRDSDSSHRGLYLVILGFFGTKTRK